MALVHLGLEIRTQQVGFLLAQLENRGGRLELDEVLVLLHQVEGVLGGAVLHTVA